MGKGDIRSRRGKIWRGTTGVTRPRKKSKTPRPAAPSRKVKTLKDLPKAVEETAVKKQAVETVPVIEHVQPEVAAVTAEVPQIVSEPVESAAAEAVSETKAKKAPAKKAPAAKKTPAAKKAPAKKKK
jgi:ribosomal small subunit protein bTHX